MAMPDCRHFSGYKPCERSNRCDSNCSHYSAVQSSIVIIHLGALGAVVRSTSLLAAIRRKYPASQITWITERPADHLLIGHPNLHRVIAADRVAELKALTFDVGFVIDKSLKAASLASELKITSQFGFTVHEKTGAVLPATAAAEELWSLGLSNHKKFVENQKAETQLLTEALELGPYQRDPYELWLSDVELRAAYLRSIEWKKNSTGPLIGINTGCSNAIPYKKLSIEAHRKLLVALQNRGWNNLVLLGGREDKERNQQIAAGLSVVQSPTELGLRDGLVSVQACDLVITGDSLGMHMAIALGKYVVAWFGPTCSQEIDLFDRGQFILSEAPCGPCWKRVCDKPVMCYDLVQLEKLIFAVDKGLQWIQKQAKSYPDQLIQDLNP